jgi:hypothetical protein
MLSLDGLSSPTSLGRDATNLEPIAWPVDPSSIVAPGNAGDAGTFYLRLVRLALDDPSRYQELHTRGDAESLRSDPAIGLLLDAARARPGSIFAPDFKSIVNFQSQKPPLLAIESVARAAIRLGTFELGSDLEAARASFEAVFRLGACLADERLVWDEFMLGVRLMSDAAAGLRSCAAQARDSSREAEIERFRESVTEHFRDRVGPIHDKLWSFADAEIAAHAGDRFAFARGSKERLWRVDAVLALGRMKYNAGRPGRPGDKKGAQTLLETLANSESDEIVRHAATLARDLDRPTFHLIKR